MTNLDSLSDEDLVRGALKGSHAYFDALVDRYSASLYRLAYGITGRHQDAEDIVQETFLRVYNNLDQYEPSRGSVRTWLLTIARNQSINIFSAVKRSMTRLLSDHSSDDQNINRLEAFPDPHVSDSEQQLVTKQEMARVQRALSKLSEKQRTALILKAQEGLSYQEIANVMGTSVSAVESLIFRARKKVTELLGDLGA